jgi:hypothetical protein
MGVWAARVPPKARPDRQHLRSQENSLQTASRFSARSQLERLVAGLAAPLARVAAQLATPHPQQPFHHEVASCFLLCRWASQPLVPGVAAQPPFHHEVVSRFLLCRWVSLCLARNHNSMHRQTPAERVSPTPQDRRGDRSGSSSRRVRYYLDTWRSLLPTRCPGHRVSIHLK